MCVNPCTRLIFYSVFGGQRKGEHIREARSRFLTTLCQATRQGGNKGMARPHHHSRQIFGPQIPSPLEQCHVTEGWSQLHTVVHTQNR